MRTAAILPVKRFASAKQRLGVSVPEELRLKLTRAMVADVLLALADTPSIERTIVVTSEDSVAEAARERGALLIEDAPEDGQSAAVALGVQAALAEGLQRVLCIPGDCPALEPAELESLLAAPRDRTGEGGGEAEVVIVPDRHGTGTNGLLLTPPGAIAPSFGPNSCERHRTLAHAAGAACRLEWPPSLLLDIDTGADLAALRERFSGVDGRAARTRAVLGQPEPSDALSIPTLT
jgi:2-phospho-L-lactate/phosphoenolpyruvate guanylyltransferase